MFAFGIYDVLVSHISPLGVVPCIGGACSVFALLFFADSSSWLSLLSCWIGGFGCAPGGRMFVGLCRFAVDSRRCRVGGVYFWYGVGVDSVRCRCRVGVVLVRCRVGVAGFLLSIGG